MLPPSDKPDASTEFDRADVAKSKINAISIADEHAAEVQQLETDAIKTASEAKPTEPTQVEGAAPKQVETVTKTKAPPGGPLKAVEGTGETKVRSLSEGVEAKAIEEKLTSNFGDLPEYQAISMSDQAARSAAYLDKDYEGAKAVAMGQERPPKDVLPESILF